MVGIAHGKPEDIGYAGIIAGSGPHPQDIMVSPLDVEIVISAQCVHDDMWARAPVEDIAEDVK